MSPCRLPRTAALLAVTTGVVLTVSALPAVASTAPEPTTVTAATSSFVGPLLPQSELRSGSQLRVVMPVGATAHRKRLTVRAAAARKTTSGLRPRAFVGPVAPTAPTTTTVTAPLASAPTAPTAAPVPVAVTPSTPSTAVPVPAETPAAAHPATSAPASPAPATTSTRTLGTVAFSGEGGRLQHTASYSVVHLNAWEADTARALKAAHPGLTVLVYKDMSSTRSYAVRDGRDDALLPTGVGYAAASAQHPEWFLEDTTGARMEWPWGGHWWMDIGNAGYQQAWAAGVAAELAAGPWDGVIIDNVMASPEWYLSGRTIRAYPTKAAYEAATESFLAAVTPRLKATGKLALGNISDASPSTWDRWVRMLDGGNHEHSFLWNNGQRYGGADWLSRVEEIERTARAGRRHSAASSYASTDRSTATWVRASWLMAWDGGASGSFQIIVSKDGDEAWDAVVSTDLGAPTGQRTQVGGAWKRDFAGGAAVVNPTSSTVTVPLGRTLRTLDGALVSSVTLAPLTGALLRG